MCPSPTTSSPEDQLIGAARGTLSSGRSRVHQRSVRRRSPAQLECEPQIKGSFRRTLLADFCRSTASSVFTHRAAETQACGRRAAAATRVSPRKISEEQRCRDDHAAKV